MSKIVNVTAFLATAVSSGLVYLLVHQGATVAAQTAGSPVAPAAGAPLAAPHDRLGKAGRRADHALPQAPAPDPDQPTGSVTGRLVDARTGAALSGVQVSSPFAGGQTVVSDDDGGFTLAGLPVGRPLRVRLGHGEGYLEDVIDARIAPDSSGADVGTVRLMKGDWSARFGGQKRGLTGINNVLRDGKIFITGVRPGTPADRAGLSAGERIVAVDGTNVDGLGHAARSYFLEGPAGTAVTLLVESPEGSTRSVVLKREARPGAEYTEPEFY